MISRIPALEFLHGRAGSYVGEDATSLSIERCGYGLVVAFRGHRSSQLCGVVGAAREGVECLALVGLPNVVRFVGDLEAPSRSRDGTISLSSEEPPLFWRMAFTGHALALELGVTGGTTESYALQEA